MNQSHVERFVCGVARSISDTFERGNETEGCAHGEAIRDLLATLPVTRSPGRAMRREVAR